MNVYYPIDILLDWFYKRRLNKLHARFTKCGQRIQQAHRDRDPVTARFWDQQFAQTTKEVDEILFK